MNPIMAELGEDHCPSARALLSQAFADDVGLWVIAGKKPSLSWLEAWFGAMLRVQLRYRQPAWVIRSADTVVAVALLSNSQKPVSLWGRLSWSLEVGRNCGWGTVWRTVQHEQQRSQQRPSQPHAVLEFIAVELSEQKKGHSRQLLEHIHGWSKSQGLAGVWLETTRPANLAFFQKFGYVLLATQRLPNHHDSFLLYRAEPLARAKCDTKA